MNAEKPNAAELFRTLTIRSSADKRLQCNLCSRRCPLKSLSRWAQQGTQLQAQLCSQPKEPLQVHDRSDPEPLQGPLGLSQVARVAPSMPNQLGLLPFHAAALAIELAEFRRLLALTCHLPIKLIVVRRDGPAGHLAVHTPSEQAADRTALAPEPELERRSPMHSRQRADDGVPFWAGSLLGGPVDLEGGLGHRSEEHTSEL